MVTPSTHRNPCFTRPTGLPCTGAPMTLGPGQPQLHSFKTKVRSLDSLWGSGRMLPWSLLPALPPESLLWLTLTCLDLLRLGLTGRQDPLFLWSLLPAPARPLGIDFLGMVLPLATESQNQPSNTCSKLGLQLAQISTDWPEALAYPHQPYSTDTSDTGKKSSFPRFGESDPILLRP